MEARCVASSTESRAPSRAAQVREYLEKIYGLPVKKVMTENFLGKHKRIQGKRKVFYYSRPNYKRAIVTFDKDAKVYNPVE